LDVGDLSAPRALAACTDGELAAGTAAGAVAVFRDGHRVGRWVAHDGPVTALAWSPGAGRLASGGADGTVRVWDPAGHPVDAARTGGPVEALAWLGDGRLAVKSGGPGGRVALYAPSSANSRQ
jgi:WD40 repeat protein